MKQPLPGRLGLFRRALNHVKLAARLLREPQVSMGWKALLVGAAAYVVLPFDLLPDFIPGIGQLDDLTVLVLAIETVIALAPEKLVAHHLSAIRESRPFAQAPVAAAGAAAGGADSTVIDTEWRRH
jgi:uncharacterized membrane protein YkvA (DUF1232 family)